MHEEKQKICHPSLLPDKERKREGDSFKKWLKMGLVSLELYQRSADGVQRAEKTKNYPAKALRGKGFFSPPAAGLDF